MLSKALRTGSKYQNPVPTSVGNASVLLKILWRYLRNREERTPRAEPGTLSYRPCCLSNCRAQSGLRVTWFGHSTLLLEIDGVRVLVDPVWELRAAPVSVVRAEAVFRSAAAPRTSAAHRPGASVA